MPTPRQILDVLPRDELALLVQQHGINLGSRARAHVLDRLEEKGPGLAGLLSGLLRPRLVDLCGQLGLSDGPKDKAALVARLSASANPEPAPSERESLSAIPPAASGNKNDRTMQLKLDDAIPTNGRAGKVESAPATPKARMASSPPPPPPPPPASDRTVSWIATFIWGIADDVLRDLYVRGKYHDVVLPMTVLRRLDSLLEPTKTAVLELKASLDKAKIVKGVVPKEAYGLNCGSLMIIRRAARFDSAWLASVMSSRVVRDQIALVQYGAAQEQINIEDARNFLLPVPPLEEQLCMSGVLSLSTEPFNRALESVAHSIVSTREYRTRLIADVVTGKLDVRDAASHLPDEADDPDPLDDADALTEGDYTDPDDAPEEADA